VCTPHHRLSRRRKKSPEPQPGGTPCRFLEVPPAPRRNGYSDFVCSLTAGSPPVSILCSKCLHSKRSARLDGAVRRWGP
jgi:hypothetical protein